MRKTLIGLACVAAVIFALLKAFPGRAWQLAHGLTFRTGRIEMKLDPHLLVRLNDKGEDEIQRPEAFSSFPIAADSMIIRQSKKCPATEAEMTETYNKIITIQNSRHERPLPSIIHLSESPQVIDCAKLTQDGGVTDCFSPKDGTYARLIISGLGGPSVRQEALTMVKSIRITTSFHHALTNDSRNIAKSLRCSTSGCHVSRS